MNQYPPRFFLSAQTPLGYVSRLSLLTNPDWFSSVWLIKGGSRVWRSALISRLADAAEQRGERVCRSADPLTPRLLEAAHWEGGSVIDAARPHPIEPKAPGALERVVWMGECWRAELLSRSRGELLYLVEQEEALREQARRYLGAAEAFWAERYRMALDATDREKIERQADRIAAQEFFPGQEGSERLCLLSTSEGDISPVLEQMDALEQVVLLEDELGPSAALLLDALLSRARKASQTVLCGYSPFAPYERLEQLIFPELSLGFFTVNERLPGIESPQRVINARRFTNRDRLAANKNRIAFHRKAARQFMAQSKEALDEAARCAEAIERIYADAFLPQQFTALCEKLMNEQLLR